MAKTQDELPWDAELVRRVGEAAKTARGGKSAAWLSAQTEKLGYKISTSVIAKLDSGHRGSVLSVAELLIIAAALDVPPLALLFPKLPDGDVEVVPGKPVSSLDAYLWATGENQGSAAARLIEESRKRDRLMKELVHLHVMQAVEGDDVLRKSKEREISSVRDAIDQADATIRELGGALDYA
jgi:hypothetical protein